MIDSMGRKVKTLSHKCWGCEGDHMFKYWPLKGYMIRIVHNLQEVFIVEDMGRSMPRIYVALDNKKLNYQSHMIEVEGNIDNQPIAILIDFGASHTYIDPNLV
jgi:hypothetical protein